MLITGEMVAAVAANSDGTGLMCNHYVHRVLFNCGYDIPGLRSTNTFLPLCAVASFYFDIPLDEMTLAPEFHRGNIVVFYSRISGNNIALVMIALGSNLLIGSNNASTFGDGLNGFQQIITSETQNPIRRDNIVRVREISAQALIEYHRAHPENGGVREMGEAQ